MLIDWPIALMPPQIVRFAGRPAIRSTDFRSINLEDSCLSRQAAPDYEFAACRMAAARQRWLRGYGDTLLNPLTCDAFWTDCYFD
jgi:hypothetical protein